MISSSHIAPILKPAGLIKGEDSGDLSHEPSILDVLHSNCGFVIAQLATKENRLNLTETSVAKGSPSQYPAEPPVAARIVDTRRHPFDSKLGHRHHYRDDLGTGYHR
jgi:hypothetical protein